MSTERRTSCALRWKPTSWETLEDIEQKILKSVNTKFESIFVTIPKRERRIRTLVFNPEKVDKPPLVMVHGFAGGIGLWILNIDELAKDRAVYVFDLLGFGRSDRPAFSKKADRAERKFVDSIEEWRKGVGLEKFVLLGHSFGGYLVSAYTLKYPERVHHLVIADGWGFVAVRKRELPMRFKVIATLLKPFNPLAPLRVAGPWGPDLVKRFRPDLEAKFAHMFEDSSIILDYIYHCNAQSPSGETAMRSMSTKLGLAVHPMVTRIQDLPDHLPITILQGETSWLDKDYAEDIKNMRVNSFVEIKEIEDAGHHLYADQSDQFNRVLKQCINKMEPNYTQYMPAPHRETNT